VEALVVGGTGPTGYFIVNGLRERGYAVTMLHSGRHERAEIPDDVEHVHTDAYDAVAVRDALGDRRFDVSVVTYGRLRAIAEVLVGRTQRFVSIGGVPAYRGYMQPGLFDPPGSPVPIHEDAPLVASSSEDDKGWRIVRTERAVFQHHPRASHFRYPYVYGPYQLMPREWCIVRRILDRRPFIVLPDGGLTLVHSGYAENLAHAVLLAVDRPEAAAGQIFNCGDEEIPTLRQLVAHIARALDADLEIVSLPWEHALPARPLVGMPWTTHRVLDLTKLKQRLGYRDKLPPAKALAVTARWLAAHPPEPGGPEETVLEDPFDYAAEDALVEAWRDGLGRMREVRFAREPGYTLSYSGPGGRSGSKPFE
jgi:nucleoside-diphosphate-sugar epimerase